MKYFAWIISVWCLLISCAMHQPNPVAQSLTSSEVEQQLWRRAQEEQDIINGSGMLYQDPEIEAYLNQVAEKLQANSVPPNLTFQIKVVQDPYLNAFAFPNGIIYVHTGILARMDNEAQLAALLAHEMVHCIHRHSLKALESIKDRSTYFDSARHSRAKTAANRKHTQLPGITRSIASIHGYTRKLETEADRVGLDLTVKANYDPREVLKLFQFLKEEIKSEGIREPYFFGTHPNVQQRIENVGTWLTEKYRDNISGIKSTMVFQSRMSRLLLDNARLDLRQGRFLIAQKTVEKFLAVKPADAQAYFLLGEIFRQRGWQDDATAAIKYYEKSILLNPSYPEPHKAMGLIHYKDGKRRLAKKYFETCLLLSPDTAEKAYIQGYLKLCATDGER